MLWILEKIDSSFINAFEDAGKLDQEVVDAYVAQYGLSGPQKHLGVKRWYYLLRENPRIRLVTVGRPLDDWHEQAKIIVGSIKILGEFQATREYVGQLGLKLQMEPINWLQGDADEFFPHGSALLNAVSEQVLDRKAIERSQKALSQKYRHSSFRSNRKA